MTADVLPFQNKLSGNYSKKVSFKNSSLTGHNQYVRKLGKGFACITVEYSLKYVGLTSAELLTVETLFGSHDINSFISWQAPIDEVAFNYRKPTSWSKDDYLEVTSPLRTAKEPKTNLSFSIRSYTKGIVRIIPIPTYIITPDVTSVIEGSTVTFTITTTNVPDGTSLYWYTEGDVSTSDFVDASLTGYLIINNNTATLVREISTSDNIEAAEVFTISLKELPSSPVLATSAEVTIEAQEPTDVTVPLANRYLAITASQVAVSKGFSAVTLGAFQTLIDRASYTPSASATYLIHLTSHQGFIYGIYYDGGINPSVIKKLDSSGNVLATSIPFDFASPPENYVLNPLISDGTHLYAFGYGRRTRFNSDLTVSISMTDTYDMFYSGVIDGTHLYVSDGSNGQGWLRKYAKSPFASWIVQVEVPVIEGMELGRVTQSDTHVWLANKTTEITKILKSGMTIISSLTLPSRVQNAPIRYFSSINALAVCFPAEDKIRFYDGTSHAFKYEFTVGDNPWEFDMDDEGNVWVANQGSEFVSIIQASNLT